MYAILTFTQSSIALFSFKSFSFLLLNSQEKKVISTSSMAATYLSTTQPHLHSLQNPPGTLLIEDCKSMDQLKQIHAEAIKQGDASRPVFQNRVMAITCTHDFGDVSYARHLFETIPEPSIYIWNTLIKGYSRVNSPKDGVLLYLELLRKNVKPDHYTFPFLLKGFTHDVALEYGKGIHGQVLKYGFDSNVHVQNALVNMYSLSGFIEMARKVFDMNFDRDVIGWNLMISAYNKVKHFNESKKLFSEMVEKGVLLTSVTLILVLSACSKSKDLDTGKKVHKYVQQCNVEHNLVVENALIDMYAACGEMNISLEIFDNMKNRDVISWTTIVAGFCNSGKVDIARAYFDRMPERDSVSWTSIIDGYLRANQFKEVLKLFREMQASKKKPDQFTVVSILTACAHLGALEIGEWVKTFINKTKIKNDIFVQNALIDMYFKCGNVEKGLRVFYAMPNKDKFTWTAVIVGLAINGYGKESLIMYSQMLKTSIAPDEITCIGVLCACTHTGMVDRGRKFFTSMITQHRIEPNVTHYGCMVDLLGRAGHLQEAYEVIKNMPMRPNSAVWGALLGACRLHKNAELAEIAATKIIELEPENGAVFVLLCNIYAACHKWENLHELRHMMMNRGIKKTPGCSLIEVNGIVHEFVAGDQSHPQSKEIYMKLDKVTRRLKFAGYSPDTSEVFLDMGEEEKERALFRHSEKLAMAFGLISSPSAAAIRIVKNLRICVDCHRMAKLVSEVYNREIIVRDRTRFHHFKHGTCSCKDYWLKHSSISNEVMRIIFNKSYAESTHIAECVITCEITRKYLQCL